MLNSLPRGLATVEGIRGNGKSIGLPYKKAVKTHDDFNCVMDSHTI